MSEILRCIDIRLMFRDLKGSMDIGVAMQTFVNVIENGLCIRTNAVRSDQVCGCRADASGLGHKRSSISNSMAWGAVRMAPA